MWEETRGLQKFQIDFNNMHPMTHSVFILRFTEIAFNTGSNVPFNFFKYMCALIFLVCKISPALIYI